MSEQNTPEWLLERKGKFTASNLDCLLVKGKDKSTIPKDSDSYPLGAGAISLCMEKLAERMSDEVMEFKSEYTDWGTEQEPVARDMFEMVTGMSVEEVGFIPAPNGLSEISGGSPDGIIDDDSIIEIKCPATSKVHLKTLLSKTCTNKTYLIQMQWNMYCTNSKKCYFVSYDPRMTLPEHKIVIIEIERDEELINQIKERILVAEKYLQELREKI